MYKINTILIFLMFLSSGIFAQEHPGVSWYDKETYAAYSKGDWNTVISLGKKALHNHIDYYYLRMRLGIAYFSKHNYHKAIPHFRKALSFNAHNPAALEYLYYCYLLSGREGDWQALIPLMPPGVKEKLKINKTSGIREVEITLDGYDNTDYSRLNDYDPSVLPGDNGFQTLTFKGGELSARVKQSVRGKISIEYGYHFLSKNRFYFYRENGIDYALQDNGYKQHQIYGGLTLHPSHGFSIGISANYLNIRSQIPFVSYSGSRMFNFVHPDNNWTTRLSFRGDLRLFSLYGGVGLAGLNDSHQMQADGGFVFYPFGNLNIYLGTGVSYLMQGIKFNDLNPKGNLIFLSYLGFKVAKPFWIELFGSSGEMFNYQSNNGWIIYNETNPVKKSLGLKLIYTLYKSGTTFFLTGIYSEASSAYYQTENLYQGIYPIDYHMLNIKTGIKWTF